MRKDVKRSLLLWPAAASAAIGALTWVNEAKQRHPVDVAAVVSHSQPWAASQPQNYDWKFVKDLPEGDWSRDLTSNAWSDSGTDDNAIKAILSLGDELPKSQSVVDFPVVAIGEIGSVVERRESGTQAMSIPGRLDDTLASDAILSDTAMLIKPPKQESFIPASVIAQASSGTFTALTQPRIALVLQAPERCERAELAGIPFAPELKSAWDSQTLLEQSVSSIDIRSLDPLAADESVFLLTPVEAGTDQVAEIPQSVVVLAKPEPTTALPESIERDSPQVAESPQIASVANTTKEQVTPPSHGSSRRRVAADETTERTARCFGRIYANHQHVQVGVNESAGHQHHSRKRTGRRCTLG